MPTETARVPIVETTIAAPRETVWRALRDPTLIARWHGWEHDDLRAEIDMVYLSGVRAREADGVLELTGLDHAFELTPHGEGSTLLRVTKPAPDEVESDDDAPFDEIEQGWTTFVQQLRFFLERHPSEERATVMLKAGGGAPLTPAAVGLDGAGLDEWFRTPHQTGLLVGDTALLVLVAHPGGGGRLILSAYGVDRSVLEEMGSRWAAALGERYGDVTDS
jgi:hypothetical protein